jgi:hypothetical protein
VSTTWSVQFNISTDELWVDNGGGLQGLGNSGIFVPSNAVIAPVFVPGYFYQPPTNIGDPVTGTWKTTDPGPGWLRVTDPLTTK